MKEKLIEFLKENIKEDLDFEKLIEVPKNTTHGDFSFPCFLLAKSMQKAPPVISKELEESLSSKLPGFLSRVVSMGPFLNFYINSEQITKQILESINNGEAFNIKAKTPEKVLIEYPSPNTNKNLHIGHVRNIFLGNSLIKILEKTGNKVIKTSINNDRGIAICKAMLGYQLFYSKETPESMNLKPDEFVASCYVKFEAESKEDVNLVTQAQNLLVKWEANDKPTRDLWEKILTWVYEGYKETYKNLKVSDFDEEFYESQIYDKGKDIVEKALADKVEGFEKDEETGAVLVDFKNETFGKKYLLRGDGTTLYMTQDIYLAKLKEEKYDCDKYVFIVGKEQQYHFEVLFDILGRLDLGGVDKNYHFAYGYVYDKDGNKFSSRKGNVLGADWLYNEVVEKSKQNLLSKELTKDLPEEELNKRAKVIGYGALAFSMLNINPMSDIKFDIEKALAFEGETGPYVQYTYARIQSILKKSNQKEITSNVDYNLFEEKEINLIKRLGEFEDVVLLSNDKYRPSSVSNYLIRVCQSFNEFYQNSKIIGSEENILKGKLLLCDSTAKVIKQGLELLGIEVLNEM